MSSNSKKLGGTLAVLLLSLSAGVGQLSAQVIINANDLTPGALTAPQTIEAVTLYAKADKDVQIKTLGVARTASDNEVFNQCIDLRGGGALDYRSISFPLNNPGELTVYLNSGSSTAARVLKVLDETGAVVAEIPAAPYVEGKAEFGKVAIAKAGTYFLTSASSGLLVYQIVFKKK